MDQLINFFKGDLLGIPLWIYLTSLATILVGFVLKKLVSVLFARLLRLTAKTSMPFDDIVIHAVTKPVEWAVALSGIFIALTILPLPAEPVDLPKFVNAVLTAVSVILVIWFATRFTDQMATWWAAKAAKTESRLDDQLIPIVQRSLKAFFVIIGIVLVLQNLGYSVGSLLAGLGIGGLALAMASKDTVANLFGSVVVFMDKPFQIGDWIEVGDLEGTVEEVGLRTTRVRTFANSLITVPNATFTTSPVNNWSRMKKRRIKMSIGVTYSSSPDKLEQLVQEIRSIIDKDEKILSDFYLVYFDNFGPSSLDVFVYCFTVTTNWAEFLAAKQDFMLQIMRAIDRLGLSMAFPTQTLHVESLPQTPQVPASQRPK